MCIGQSNRGVVQSQEHQIQQLIIRQMSLHCYMELCEVISVRVPVPTIFASDVPTSPSTLLSSYLLSLLPTAYLNLYSIDYIC